MILLPQKSRAVDVAVILTPSNSRLFSNLLGLEQFAYMEIVAAVHFVASIQNRRISQLGIFVRYCEEMTLQMSALKSVTVVNLRCWLCWKFKFRFEIIRLRCQLLYYWGVIAGLQRAKRASEAPLVRKIGNPSSRENLVMTSPYERPSSVQTLGEGRGVSMSPAISGVPNWYVPYTSWGHSHIHVFSGVDRKNYRGRKDVHIFIFFSVRERAEFNKSCNLIGSGSGRNFPIRPALGGRNHKKCSKFLWKPFQWPLLLRK